MNDIDLAFAEEALDATLPVTFTERHSMIDGRALVIDLEVLLLNRPHTSTRFRLSFLEDNDAPVYTNAGEQLVDQLDRIPGVQSVWARRYQLTLELAGMFPLEEITAQARLVLERVLGANVHVSLHHDGDQDDEQGEGS